MTVVVVVVVVGLLPSGYGLTTPIPPQKNYPGDRSQTPGEEYGTHWGDEGRGV